MKIRKSLTTALSGTALLLSAICVFAQNANNQDDRVGNDSLVKDFTLEENGWRIADYTPYLSALRDLEKLNKQYSENILKLAIDEYSAGIDILESLDQEVAEIIETNKRKINLNEHYYWQEIDRRNQEYRQIAYKKRQAKVKAVTYLTKAINDSDAVQNTEIRNEPRFINFQARLYQAYVATQYDIQNLKPCIPILERYIKLTSKTREDVWAYRYLASCYGFMEKMMGQYKYTGEDELMQYRNKKNSALLIAAELTYGVESPQYKRMQETVQKDERKSERINDFK